MVPDFERERAAMAAGALRVAGVDEAGRGPLAGPVYAAAVVLDPARIPEGLTDSKLLAAARREALAEALAEVAQVSIAWASVEEIDSLNILNATYLAMTRALAGLKAVPQMALIDGNGAPAGLPCRAEAVVKGDATCLSIAAASIVAKVARDREMCALAQHFAGYGWERNAGYGTEEHLHALRNLGVTPHHRRSFRPVYEILCQGKSVSD